MEEANILLTNELKQVLTNFAVPNSSTLLQASKDLHNLSQNSSFLTSLFYIVSNDEVPQLRQTAAVVFRRKSAKLWKSFDTNLKGKIQDAVLQCLVKEKEKVVQHAIMEIIGSIAKEEFATDKQWPDLMNFIQATIQSHDAKQIECAAELLKIVCESSAEYFEGQFDPLLILINEALKTTLSMDASFYFVEAFNLLIPYLGDDQARYVRPLVPKCVQVIKILLDNNCESQASELIELFESLIETEVSFIASYVKDLILFLLQIAGNIEMDDDIRTRVLSVLQCIIRMKKKAILKNKLIGSILEVVCPILVSPLNDSIENDETGFIGESSDIMTPLSSSLRVIDDMALHFPPAELYKNLITFIEACITSNEERFKRGLLLILACLSEGTSEYIKSKHMRQFLEVVCRGVLDPRSRVGNAALFALGQFSEHLQPDINEYASEIMPLLFQTLHSMTDEKRGSGITKAYYALENFVENLESGILPYLEKLMQHLLETLKSTSVIHIKELVISAIGAICNAAQEHLLPYLPDVLEQIQNCLSSLNGKGDDGEMCILHTQTLDTLAVLVRNLGKLRIQLAEDSMKLGMRLVDMPDADPDLRRSAYGLFAAVASVVGENLQPFLASIIRCIINSIQSTEGIIPHFNSKESGVDFSFLDDSTTDLDSGEEEIDSELVEGFSVENSYMDEKIDAIDALGDFAKHCGKSFKPHLDVCLEEVVKLKDFPHSDIRKASVTAFGQLIIAAYTLNHVPPNDINLLIFPLLSNIILTDRERLVVMAALTAAKEIIESCGLEIMVNKQDDLKALMNAVESVFHQKSACQDDDINDDDDDQQAEYDEMLLEYCGELFPILADKLKQDFLPNFLNYLPFLLNKLKPNCSTSEKSFSAGIIAETVEKLGPCCPELVLKNVIPRFVQLSRDSETEVRNNAIFGLGILLQNGGDAACRYYTIVLNCLSTALDRERSRKVIDNILSSLARMISANKQSLPLKQILPGFLSHLPIQEDHNEDTAVYGCLATLLRDSDVIDDPAVVAKIFDIFALVLIDGESTEDIKLSIENDLKLLKSQNHPSVAQLTRADKLNPMVTELLQRL